MKTTLGLLAVSPWLGLAITEGSAQANPWAIGKDLTFGALTWYLIVKAIPRMMDKQDSRIEASDDLHRKEREKSDMAHAKERLELLDFMNANQRDNRELLEKIAKQHAKSTETGHAAAKSLASEVRSLAESLD